MICVPLLADWRTTEVHWLRVLELTVLAIFVGTM